MPGIKTVKLDKKYQVHVQSLKKEQDLVQDVIQSTFSKFQNEQNFNTMEYALDILVNEYKIHFDYTLLLYTSISLKYN